MRDLEIATRQLKNSSYAFVAVKDGNVICCKEGGGIKPLLHAIDELGEDMKGSCVADKVIGKAAAALCVFGGVIGIYTPVMSRSAVGILEENGVVYSADYMAQGILNKDKSDLCPLEKLTADADCCEDILDIVREFTGRPFK